ncbi:ribosome maturation factor RimP [Tenacibaculum adriaticum]|uniref:Ribosome maturation factor RimP n=2 Tax=Tenacibaculum adriaticum TaxID=413713 RepID=A0A5S5E0P8_9FLAO|nr:ribosome maturation factor RimP [Tenacibaculum adriaticum]
MSPLFIPKMNQEKVKILLQEALDENQSLYLIDLQFLANGKIKVIVDGDSGIPLSECVRISRNIEHNLDREEEDFSLEVTSPDISHPLKIKRQYIKNIDRVLKVKTQVEDFEGILKEVLDEAITLKWEAREPKPIGKGKHTVEKSVSIPYADIIEAKVKIIF